MATDTISPKREVPSSVEVSRTQRLVQGIVSLPGPTSVSIVGLGLLIGIVAHLPLWAAGERAVGDLELQLFLPMAMMAIFLWLTVTLRGVAVAAFRDFRPALEGSGVDEQLLARELTVLPDRDALVAVAIVEIVVFVGYFTSPGGASAAADQSPLVIAVLTLLFAIALVPWALLILQAIRHLRLVDRLYAAAASIDLFDPAPINALSRLTAATGAVIIFIAIFFVLPTDDELYVFGLVQGVVLVAIAGASFVLPLRGMHRRLEEEQGRMLSATHDRLKVTIARIHETVDRDDTGRADELQKTLASLLAERDLLLRLRTWPWSPGTLRGFASAMLLPIVLWLVFRVLERVV